MSDYPIQEVRLFLDDFFEAERQLKALERRPDLDAFNQAYEAYCKYLIPQLQGRLGIRALNTLFDEVDYQSWAKLPTPERRDLFKIEVHENSVLGRVYLAYVSSYTPELPSFALDQLLILNRVEDQLRIIDYSVLSTLGNPFGEWSDNFCESISFEELTNPVLVERVTPPKVGLGIYEADGLVTS